MASTPVSGGARSDSAARQTDRAWSYDVFLSFRGEDTCRGFTGHLYDALRTREIHTYIDVGLPRGDGISSALHKAIEESKLSIVVFSKNYASSTWCLEELVKILECRMEKNQLVVPVFCDVDPSEIRHQRGCYGEAMAKHQANFKDKKEKLLKWRLALHEAANLSGWHFKPGFECEGKLIESIVEEVSRKINRIHLRVANYPVGLESRVQEISSLLGVGSADKVLMIGIWGMGGIGKTTIARAVYKRFSDTFDGSCFLPSFRENSSRHGLVQLQEKLLSDILGERSIKLGDVNKGISILKRRLCQKKVLLVLDDIDNMEQLELTAGKCDWFGFGSRIIVTTRDKHILVSHGVERLYEVRELNHQEGLELICWSAFRDNKVDSSYKDVLNQAIIYAHGLPLALELIGSNFYHKTVYEWQSALRKYERTPGNSDRRVQEILKVVYEDLDKDEKKVFMDIACFLKGYAFKFAAKILQQTLGFRSDFVIRGLIEKSFIHIECGVLRVHDLIMDFAREISRHQSLSGPFKCMCLWSYDDVLHVLKENTETGNFGLISQKGLTKESYFGMPKRTVCFVMDLNHHPNSLRFLKLQEYSISSLLSELCMERIVMLSLVSSHCIFDKQLKKFEFLSRMDFKGCKFLCQLPDLSGVPNITDLCLDHCKNLVEVHDSIGFLEKLRILSVKRCAKLSTFTHAMKLTSLECLYLSDCSSLQSFPEILGRMENIKYVDLVGTGIQELPFSIVNLIGLKGLNLKGCRRLDQLPSSILDLPKLETIEAQSCNEFKFVSISEGQEHGSSIVSSNVTYLDLRACSLSDQFLLASLSCFPYVKYLNLMENKFTVIPACIKECFYLRHLCLDDCKLLREIRGIPTNIKILSAINCTSLTSLSTGMLLCQALHEARNTRFMLPGGRIPEWFDHFDQGGSVSFWVRKKFPAISLCFVLCILDKQPRKFKLKLCMVINGNFEFDFNCSYFLTLEADHILLFDLQSQMPYDVDKLLIDRAWNHVQISCVSEPKMKGNVLEKVVIRWSGVHVYKQQSSMEDIWFMYPNPRKRKDLFYNIDDLEPNCYPLLKKQHMFLCGGDFENRQQNLSSVTQYISTSCKSVFEQRDKYTSVCSDAVVKPDMGWLSLLPNLQQMNGVNMDSNSLLSRRIGGISCDTGAKLNRVCKICKGTHLGKGKQTSTNQPAIDTESIVHPKQIPEEKNHTQNPEVTENQGSGCNKADVGLVSMELCTDYVAFGLNDPSVKATFASLESESSALAQFIDTETNTAPVIPKLSEETKKALQILRDFASKKFSLLLHPGRLRLMKIILDYLLSLSADDGISLAMKSVMLQLSRSFTFWSKDYDDASIKHQSTTNDLLKVNKLEVEIEANINEFREVDSFEDELCSQLACLLKRRRELEEHLNAIRDEIMDYKEKFGRKSQYHHRRNY